MTELTAVALTAKLTATALTENLLAEVTAELAEVVHTEVAAITVLLLACGAQRQDSVTAFTASQRRNGFR